VNQGIDVAARYNEGKAIDAVLRRIEARENASRLGDGRSPDDLRDPDPDRRVDYVCTVGNQLYALEHTGIEPFDNQIQMEVRNAALFDPIIARFDNRTSDAEYWELHHPIEAADGLSGGKIKPVQNALITWMETNAATLPVVRYGDRYPYSAYRESIPGVPFRFSLYRWSLQDFNRSPLSGKIWRRAFVTGDVEKARQARLERSCDDKFSKLAKWKRDEGARSVLVMEENDLSLTNHQLVAEAVARAEAGRSDVPDEVFLVSTTRPNPWWVTCLRREGKNYYDDGERFHELDPATLTQLTKR
jgi:hypothetical protein